MPPSQKAPRPPKTRDEQMLRGYKFDNHARCRGCKAEIEWWITPSGAKMPVDMMPTGNTAWVAHFSTCPNREDFKR